MLKHQTRSPSSKDADTKSVPSNTKSRPEINPPQQANPIWQALALTATPFYQTKLNIGESNDKYEKEADAMADAVVKNSPTQIPSISSVSSTEPDNKPVMRTESSTKGSAETSPTTNRVSQAIDNKGEGQPLATHVKNRIESIVGHDLSGVRVHSDKSAHGAANALHAKAFTHGKHIYMGEGQSTEDLGLMAHEATHTIQQSDDSTAHGTKLVQKQDEEDDPPEPTAQQRTTIQEIRDILSNTWVGPLDEYDLEAKWASFGNALPDMAQQYFHLWTQSINRGAELEDLAGVNTIKTRFGNDVKAKALGYMQQNRILVEQELRNFGVDPAGGMYGASATATPQIAGDEEARAHTVQLREVARIVKQAQMAQSMLRNIEVGYTFSPEAAPGLLSFAIGDYDPQEHARDLVARSGRRHLMPTGFSPYGPPAHPPFGDERPAMTPHTVVQKHYDDVTGIIEGFSSQYPSIYAVIQEGDIDELIESPTPRDARQLIIDGLNETLVNMNNAEGMISSGDLDYHDLQPIIQQLRTGESASSGTNWSESFPAWCVDQDMEGHRSREFWITLGLSTLAAAGFIFMNMATFGTATFFVAATVGVGASAALTARSWEHFDDLSTAAGAEISSETQLVRSGQATFALVTAIINTVFTFLQARGVLNAARSASMSSSIRALLPSTEAVAESALNNASNMLARRIGVLRSQIINALARRGNRFDLIEAIRRDLDAIRQTALTNAGNIRNGTGAMSAELQGLSQAERNALADRLLREVGQEYRDAIARLESAELMVPQVVNPNAAQGYGARPLGPPPVRRPPSGHTGEGWENW